MWFEAMHASWQVALAAQRPLLESLELTLSATNDISPSPALVMRAFKMPLDDVRVLLVGQDPYPTPGVACGLAFAVANYAESQPASLRNILKELRADLPDVTFGGDIARWQTQGVFLLNRHLTTQLGKPAAHAKTGWTTFTDAAVRALAEKRGGHFVALLWGNHAQQLAPLLPGTPIISGVHPSPLSAHRGFFGSRPFSAVNRELGNLGEPSVDWSC